MAPLTIPLADPSLEAKIENLTLADISHRALWFTCPLCADTAKETPHRHVIPYRPGLKQHGIQQGMHVWGHLRGLDLEDLTLQPSYKASHTDRGTGVACMLHIFVRDGEMQILGDSKLMPG